MNKKMIVLLAAAVSCAAWGEVKLGTPFGDGMVLQREKKVCVWGTAEKGETVTVKFAGKSARAKADADGAWRVQLPPLKASKESRTLTVTGSKTKKPIALTDVLVGEVWYVSGQSNTEMPLVGERPHYQDRDGILAAHMTFRPFIRYAYASDYKTSVTPKKTAEYPVEWKKFSPETLGTKPSFSSMGVYFALELYAALDVPIGLVGSYWSGTTIDAWTPVEGYAGKDALAEPRDWKRLTEAEWNAKKPQHPVFNVLQNQPSVLWNEMVESWCPFVFRGLIWYQGCNNLKDGEEGYLAKLHAFYDGWSKKFENPQMKMYIVQLAPYKNAWFPVQKAQARFCAEEKNAAYVTTCDIGNPADIHPSDKRTVGKRLAALALKHDYGFDFPADPPKLVSAKAEGKRVVLSFTDAEGWYVYDPAWKEPQGFEVAGADGAWRAAKLKNLSNAWQGFIDGKNLVLVADGVEKPVKARYLANPPGVGRVYSKTSGLPLGPFETDVR